MEAFAADSKGKGGEMWRMWQGGRRQKIGAIHRDGTVNESDTNFRGPLDSCIKGVNLTNSNASIRYAFIKPRKLNLESPTGTPEFPFALGDGDSIEPNLRR